MELPHLAVIRFNELVPPNRTHYAEVFYGSMILWHCNMVLIFELGSILINHFIIRIRSDHFGPVLLIQPNGLVQILAQILGRNFWPNMMRDTVICERFEKNNLVGLRYKPMFVNVVLAISLFTNNIANIFINNYHCTDPTYPLLTCSIHELLVTWSPITLLGRHHITHVIVKSLSWSKVSKKGCQLGKMKCKRNFVRKLNGSQRITRDNTYAMLTLYII